MKLKKTICIAQWFFAIVSIVMFFTGLCAAVIPFLLGPLTNYTKSNISSELSSSVEPFFEFASSFPTGHIGTSGLILLLLGLFFYEASRVTKIFRLGGEISIVVSSLKRSVFWLVGCFFAQILHVYFLREAQALLVEVLENSNSLSEAYSQGLTLMDPSVQVMFELVMPSFGGATCLVVALIIILFIQHLIENDRLSKRVKSLEQEASLVV